MNKIYILCVCLVIGSFIQCKQEILGPLPILGNVDISNGDTIYHTIPEFKFFDQNKQPVTNQDLDDHLYLADYFFMSCPTICPDVKKQMLRIYDKYETNDIIKLVSHTMDPVRDTPEKLKKYAANLGVNDNKWLFLSGQKDSLLDMSDEYFIVAYEDVDAPGGFDHSGKIILVDKNRHVRAFAEGTDPDDVTQLLKDIDRLIAEYEIPK